MATGRVSEDLTPGGQPPGEVGDGFCALENVVMSKCQLFEPFTVC